MKKIDTLQVTDPSVLQPFTARSLKFLQDATAEDVAGIIKSIVTSNLGSYSLTVPYVISGCVVSDSNKDVTAGEIFYGGKYYETTAVNGTTNTAQFVLTLSQDATADPVTFSDSSSKNVHNIYKYVATDTATAGDFDATDLVSLYGTKVSQQITLASQTVSSGTYTDLTGLTYTTGSTTKTYRVKCKANAEMAQSVTPGSIIQYSLEMCIYNGDTAAVVDECKMYKYLEIVSGGNYQLTCTEVLVCETIVTLPASKTIKAQAKYAGSSNAAITNAKFFIEEI